MVTERINMQKINFIAEKYRGREFDYRDRVFYRI